MNRFPPARLLPFLLLIACKGDDTYKMGELTQYLGQAPFTGPYVPRLAGCELQIGSDSPTTYKWDGKGRLVESGQAGVRYTWKYADACMAALVVEGAQGDWEGTCGDEDWPTARDFEGTDCDSTYDYTMDGDEPVEIVEKTCDAEYTTTLTWEKRRVTSRATDTLEWEYDYDKHGNMIVETIYDPDAAVETDVVVWEYDKDDRPISMHVVTRDSADTDEDPIEFAYDGDDLVPDGDSGMGISGSCPD